MRNERRFSICKKWTQIEETNFKGYSTLRTSIKQGSRMLKKIKGIIFLVCMMQLLLRRNSPLQRLSLLKNQDKDSLSFQKSRSDLQPSQKHRITSKSCGKAKEWTSILFGFQTGSIYNSSRQRSWDSIWLFDRISKLSWRRSHIWLDFWGKNGADLFLSPLPKDYLLAGGAPCTKELCRSVL